MKTIKIYYKGGLDEQLEDIIKDAFGRISYTLIGSGYNFQTKARDLEFEFQAVPKLT